MPCCPSGYDENAYGAHAYRGAAYAAPLASCDGCPGTSDMQTAWDAIAGSSPSISTAGTTLPDIVAIAMYTGGPAPSNVGSWVFDATEQTVTVTSQNIMTGEPEITVYPVSDACIQTCRDTFDYWYNL